jgi:O-antigen/teichoic acid export membrane protein
MIISEIRQSRADTPPRANTPPIEHRAFRVSLVNGASTLLTMIFQFVAVPVCLKYWGAQSYGKWLALFSAFMLLRSLDGGYGNYVGNKLNYLYHKSMSSLREHLASAAIGVAVTGSMQLALAVSALLFRPVAAALGITTGDATGLDQTLGLLLLTLSWVLTGSYLGVVHRLLVPTGLMYQAAWWAMAFQVCQFASIMLTAVLRLDMLQTSGLFALSQVLIYVASALYVRAKLPQFVPWWQGARRRIAFSDLKSSLALSASNVVQQGATNGAVLIVAGLLGPAAVPIFTTVRTLTNLWTAVTTVLTAPLLPEVVRLHATGQTHKLFVINESYWTLVGSTVNLGTLIIYPVLPFFYLRWTGRTVELNQPLVCLLLASVIIANAGGLMTLHLTGLNRLRVVLSASMARALFGLGGGALLISNFGLPGIGLGILAGEALATALITRTFMRELLADGVSVSGAALGPVILSSGSALLFFLNAAFTTQGGNLAWLLAITCASTGAIWGWKRMDSQLRARLTQLPMRVLKGA